jgi:ABC-type multidrug transport system ATPase subunit
MIQRFMIAKALIHDPTLLLFDEPFSGLDLAAKQFVLKRIDQERSRGKGIILTTHNTELGYHTGSRFHFLLNGQIETVAEKEDIGLEALAREYEDRLKR